MNRTVLLGLIATIVLVIACFFPWVTIESKNIVMTGVDTTGTRFGKPGYFNFILAGIYLLLLLIKKDWTKKAALFFAAFNFAWSFRNFLILPLCYGGICPEKEPAIFIVLICSFLMLLAVLLTKTVVKQTNEQSTTLV
jgi:hypothetical protein